MFGCFHRRRLGSQNSLDQISADVNRCKLIEMSHVTHLGVIKDELAEDKAPRRICFLLVAGYSEPAVAQFQGFAQTRPVLVTLGATSFH